MRRLCVSIRTWTEPKRRNVRPHRVWPARFRGQPVALRRQSSVTSNLAYQLGFLGGLHWIWCWIRIHDTLGWSLMTLISKWNFFCWIWFISIEDNWGLIGILKFVVLGESKTIKNFLATHDFLNPDSPKASTPATKIFTLPNSYLPLNTYFSPICIFIFLRN